MHANGWLLHVSVACNAGRELNSDSKLVREMRVVDGTVLQAMHTPVTLEYTRPPADIAAYLASSPAAILSEQVLLLSLAACP